MATVKFYLKNPKANGSLRTDEVSIVLKFTLSRGQRFEITTGEKIIPKYWDTVKQQVKSNHRRHVEMNQSLRKIQEEIIQMWRENRTADAPTLRNLAEPLIRFVPAEEKKTILEGVDRFIAQYATEKEASTVKRYEALKKKLSDFLETYSVTWETLDMNFLDAFKRFLYAIPNPLYTGFSLDHSDSLGCYVVVKGDSGRQIGLFDDVVFKYIINLKTVLAWCEERGYPVNPSFKKWRVINREYPVISLSKAELEKVENAEISARTVAPLMEDPTNEYKAKAKANALNIARDYFLIECRTGQRIGDIMKFNIKDVHDHKWVLAQKKGSRMLAKVVTIPFTGFCAPAYWIFQKHNFKLPKMAQQNINYAIKDVCRIAGIDDEMYIERWAGNKRIRIYGKKYEFLSSHSGRKSFVTIALQDMPTSMVMQLTGIKSERTLRHYRGESETEQVEKYLNQIEQSKTVMKKAN